MSYATATDLLALIRQTSGGQRVARMPGLDYIVVALARAGFFQIFVGQSAPVANQATTLWFQPNINSWLIEGTVWLWNATAAQYQPATPSLWSALLFSSPAAAIVQDVTTAGPVTVETIANVVRVQNVGAPVTLLMPLSTTVLNPVLISDWANHAGTNNILITLSGSDTFPLNATTQTIAADGGSVLLRPVPGGFAL